MQTVEYTNFHFIWDKWIKNVIDTAISEMDEEYKVFVSVETVDLEKLKNQVDKYYQKTRKKLKREYYGRKCENLESKHLSFFKLSAIICDGLIQNKVVRFNYKKANQYRKEKKIGRKNTDWFVRNVLINYRIAFFASLSFLFHITEYEYYEKGKVSLLEALKQQSTFILFETSDGNNQIHESLDNYIILNLSKRNRSRKDFDYFLYASLMLGIQKYNELILKNDNQ